MNIQFGMTRLGTESGWYRKPGMRGVFRLKSTRIIPMDGAVGTRIPLVPASITVLENFPPSIFVIVGLCSKRPNSRTVTSVADAPRKRNSAGPEVIARPSIQKYARTVARQNRFVP